MIEQQSSARLLNANGCWCLVCHYRHKLAVPPIISWPEFMGFSGIRPLDSGIPRKYWPQVLFSNQNMATGAVLPFVVLTILIPFKPALFIQMACTLYYVHANRRNPVRSSSLVRIGCAASVAGCGRIAFPQKDTVYPKKLLSLYCRKGTRQLCILRTQRFRAILDIRT
jgi:hypothetical protein